MATTTLTNPNVLVSAHTRTTHYMSVFNGDGNLRWASASASSR